MLIYQLCLLLLLLLLFDRTEILGDNPEMNNELEEILNEKLLRDLTRAFIDFFESIFVEKPKKNLNGTIIIIIIIIILLYHHYR